MTGTACRCRTRAGVSPPSPAPMIVTGVRMAWLLRPRAAVGSGRPPLPKVPSAADRPPTAGRPCRQRPDSGAAPRRYAVIESGRAHSPIHG
ncbi:hypothetical protein DC008_01410 [Streptomyces nigra]|nr:hypothetical protein DC008_01410 [Streptomyces nigra]